MYGDLWPWNPRAASVNQRKTGLSPKDNNAEATLRTQTLMFAYNWKSFRHYTKHAKSKNEGPQGEKASLSLWCKDEVWAPQQRNEALEAYPVAGVPPACFTRSSDFDDLSSTKPIVSCDWIR